MVGGVTYNSLQTRSAASMGVCRPSCEPRRHPASSAVAAPRPAGPTARRPGKNPQCMPNVAGGGARSMDDQKVITNGSEGMQMTVCQGGTPRHAAIG